MFSQSNIFINLLLTFGSLFTIFIFFLQNNNPLLIDYLDNDNNKDCEQKSESETKSEKQVVKKAQSIYENKYLEKFKTFPNEFKFSDLELELEKNYFEELKANKEHAYINEKKKLDVRLLKINEIFEKGGIDNKKEEFSINDFGKKALIKFSEYDDEDEDEDDIDFEELFLDIIVEKVKLEEELKKLEELYNSEGEEELKNKAHEFIINKKLDTYNDNYILESTPLGNIFMRFNNDKKSFEYFSNNTIPYRYLEPVGRKYVMTFWCKPIFVDIEEELKKSEEKYQEEMKKMEEEKKNIDPADALKNKFQKLKGYNKENTINSIKMTSAPSKNRGQASIPLPPQIKANLPNVNSNNEKKFLKENANRYTWEGRLNSFSLLKKIDKKIVNKNLSLSFAEFKKIQKNKK
jgi:hypothetical protein